MTAPVAFDPWTAVDRTTRIRLLATLVEERAGDDANTTVETFPSIVAAMRVIKNEADTLDDEIEGAFTLSTSRGDEVRQAIEAHGAALAAYQAASAGPAKTAETARLGAVEKAARDRLIAIVPTTLVGLADKVNYCLAFSLPAWEDSDDREPSDMLRTIGEALAGLVGRPVSA